MLPKLPKAQMVRVAFAIPGDINRPTGGYAYDRKVLARLGAAGVEATHFPLPGSFPYPEAADVAHVIETLQALPADAVVLFDGLAYGAMPASAIARVAQPIVALCHHPLALETGLDSAQQSYFRSTEVEALAMARHVVVTSKTTRRCLISEYAVPEAKVTVAEPGTERGARARSNDSRMRLLAVGSIIPRKGYRYLIEALSEVPDRQWHLTIVGSLADNTTVAEVGAAITSADLVRHVELRGALPSADLAGLYAGSDIFVLPSLYEGYGMVLAEAMAHGLPIVSTTGGAAAETVPDSAALKVPPADAKALACAIGRLISDHDLRHHMAAASWQAGLSLPTWDDTTRIIAAVLSAIGRNTENLDRT